MLSLEDLKSILEKENLSTIRPVDRDSLLKTALIHVLGCELRNLSKELSEVKEVLQTVLSSLPEKKPEQASKPGRKPSKTNVEE